MKKIIIGVFCIIGLVGCVDVNRGIETNNEKKDVPPFAEGYSSSVGDTFVRTFKDSNGNPHKVVIFEGVGSMAAIDLDANSYNK